MKVSIKNRMAGARTMLATAVVAGILTSGPLVAQEKPTTGKDKKKEYRRDLDKEIEQLEKAKTELEKHRNTDYKKVEEEIRQAIANIDMDKIKHQAEAAMQKVDFERIHQQIAEATAHALKAEEHMSKHDMQQMKEALEKSKLAMEKQKEFFHQDISAEMEKAKKEIEKAQEQFKLQKTDFHKSFQDAQKSIAEAKEEMKRYQEMIYAMEAEGLLDTKKDYTIQYEDEKLRINGNEQPQSVADKYRKYFRRVPFTYKKEDGKIILNHK